MRNWMVLFIILLTGCATLEGRDDSYKKLIVGSWLLMDQQYEDAYSISLLALTKDGRKCVVGTNYLLNGQETNVNYWDSRWKIEDGYLISKVVKSSSHYTQPGSVIRDKIIRFENNQFDLLMETDSDFKPRLEKHIRLTDEDPSRICEVVDAAL